ncbi:putative RNA-directed DNA polymerase [Tanacetum coccineum]
MSENGPWLIRNVPLILKKWTPDANRGRASNARPMVELRADFELKDTIVVVVPKFFGDGYTMSIIHVEYEWATPRCLSCHVFGHGIDECPKKIVSDVFLVMVETGNKAFTSGVQEDGQRSTPLVERIDIFEKRPLEWKCVLVDDDGKPLENVDYSSNQGSEDEVDSVDNEMTSYLASKSSGVEYATKSLLEQ